MLSYNYSHITEYLILKVLDTIKQSLHLQLNSVQ